MAGKRRSLSLPFNVKSGSFNAGTMLLLTNGTVLVNNSGGSEWPRFTPDPTNGYVGGSSGLESNMTKYAPFLLLWRAAGRTSVRRGRRIFRCSKRHTTGRDIRSGCLY